MKSVLETNDWPLPLLMNLFALIVDRLEVHILLVRKLSKVSKLSRVGHSFNSAQDSEHVDETGDDGDDGDDTLFKITPPPRPAAFRI